MTRPILFLDVDGVLNGHEFDPSAQSNTINRGCVAHLNRVIEATDCAIVISSAWRYMVLGGSMNIRGFEWLLRSHGVCCGGSNGADHRVIGVTGPGEESGCGLEARGRLIRNWLNENGHDGAWAVVDDLDVGGEGMPLVLTDGTAGMTEHDAEALIAMLLGRAT